MHMHELYSSESNESWDMTQKGYMPIFSLKTILTYGICFWCYNSLSLYQDNV